MPFLPFSLNLSHYHCDISALKVTITIFVVTTDSEADPLFAGRSVGPIARWIDSRSEGHYPRARVISRNKLDELIWQMICGWVRPTFCPEPPFKGNFCMSAKTEGQNSINIFHALRIHSVAQCFRLVSWNFIIDHLMKCIKPKMGRTQTDCSVGWGKHRMRLLHLSIMNIGVSLEIVWYTLSHGWV